MARRQKNEEKELTTLKDYKTIIGGKLLQWQEDFIKRTGPDLAYMGLVGTALFPAINQAIQGNWLPLTLIGGELGREVLKDNIKAFKGKKDSEVAKLLKQLSEKDARMLQVFENIDSRLQLRDEAFKKFNQEQQERFLEAIRSDIPVIKAEIKIDKLIFQLPINQPTTQYNYDPAVIEQYLHYVKERYDSLPLVGRLTQVDQQIEESHRELSQLYTTLYTMNEREILRFKEGEFSSIYLNRGENRLSVMQVLEHNRKLVLLGDAGSGKTTFVDFLSICMAGELVHDPHVNLDRFTTPLNQEEDELQNSFWSWGAKLPIRIVLRDFVARAMPKVGNQGKVKYLTDYLSSTLKEELGCEIWEDNLLPYLRLHGGFVLFDGLDEVSEEYNHRYKVKQVIEAFVAGFPKCHVLVTSRPYAYEETSLKLKDFQSCQIAPFTLPQITSFIEHWYAYIGSILRWDQGKISYSKKNLIDDIRSREKVRELAARPLLLNLMAYLHVNDEGRLPDNLAELLKRSVLLLLDKWQRRLLQDDVEIEPSFQEYLKIGQQEILTVLEEIALQIHAQEKRKTKANQGAADIPEILISKKLREAAKTKKANTIFLEEYLNNRAGLVIPKGNGYYCFPHRAFQEYLAACALIKDENDFPDNVVELIDKEPNRWREVLDLIPSMIPPFMFWSLFEAMYDDDIQEEDPTSFTEKEWWRIRLLADMLRKKQNEFSKLKKKRMKYPKEISILLVSLLEHSALNPLERAGAGNALAQLGDPRFRDDLYALPQGDMLGFKEIPAGPFLMGSDEKTDQLAYDDEYPQLEVTLPLYYMAQYPVTVGQWLAYLKDTEHPPTERWQRYNQHANHPVVNINWHAARKYCHWLNQKLVNNQQVSGNIQELLLQGWRFRLSVEAEWEKAARGNHGLIYPYGNDFEQQKGNTAENGINTTTPVGCYRFGKSLFDCEEMSGNVWEWTLSEYKPYQKKNWTFTEINLPREKLDDTSFVLRGGSWNFNRRSARCAARDGGFPLSIDLSVGFRILLSPIIEPTA